MQQSNKETEEDPLTNPKNQKVLNRKQIEKRLQGLKIYEYEKITRNLTNQNHRLKQQVKDLHEKVNDLLMAKKMLHSTTPKNSAIEDEVKTLKKELDIRYEKMNYYKDQIRQFTTDQLGEDVKLRTKDQTNRIHSIKEEIKHLLKQKAQQLQMYQENNQSLEEYHPKVDDSDERIKQLKAQNRELKQKIHKVSVEAKIYDKDDQSAIDKLFALKQEQKQMKTLLGNKKKITSMSQIKSIDYKELDMIKKEVDELKKQKKEAEKQLVSEKINKDQRKDRLSQQAKELFQFHKQLLRRRMKSLNQLNLYQSREKQQKQLLQQQQKKDSITYEDRGAQTDTIVRKDFRKEWIGKSEGTSFDDSFILDYKSQISIKSVMIYKNAENIVFTKFFYQTPTKKRFQTKVPLDSSILRKCESKKYSAKGDSFMKGFKVWLTNQKITKIEILWSDGETAMEGWQSEGSTKYTADINPDEKPICMFGTITFQGKNNYTLQSLGCQINTIEMID